MGVVSFKTIVLVFAFAWIVITPFLRILPDAQMQAGMMILIFAALLWITEALPLPLTALLIPLLAIVSGVLDPVAAFANFANPIIFLFFGGFVLAAALSKYELDVWLSSKMLKLSSGNFVRSSIMLMMASAFISMWVSNTSTAIMMLPIAIGLLNQINKEGTTAESKFLLLGIAYAANIGGVATLIGSPPNAIGASVLNLSFLQWLKYGIPVFACTFPIMIAVLYYFFKPDKKLNFNIDSVKTLPRHKNFYMLIVIFIITIMLWLMEDFIAGALDIKGSFSAVVAIFAVFLLIITRLITWNEIEKKVEWGVLILFGGGLTLGAVLSVSGFGEFIARKIVFAFEGMHPFFFLWIIVFTSIMFTEVMSNTASAALFVPVLYSISQQMEINPVLFVIPATIAATFGFMLPVGTPPNAIVYGTGKVPQRSMIRAGLILNMVFSVIITLVIFILI